MPPTDDSDEIEEMRLDALKRAEAAWREVSTRLAQNAPGSEIDRLYAAEGRAIRIMCLMLYRESPFQAWVSPDSPGAKPRQSRWKDRGAVLNRMEEALRDYVGGFPVGGSQDLPFAFDIERAVGVLRARIREEKKWRHQRSEVESMPHGIVAVAWHPKAKPGPARALEAIAALVREYDVDAETLAQLESIGRLPVEPFYRLDGSPLLLPWDPKGDKTLFLPPGDTRFDSQLRNGDRVKDWRRVLKKGGSPSA